MRAAFALAPTGFPQDTWRAAVREFKLARGHMGRGVPLVDPSYVAPLDYGRGVFVRIDSLRGLPLPPTDRCLFLACASIDCTVSGGPIAPCWATDVDFDSDVCAPKFNDPAFAFRPPSQSLTPAAFVTFAVVGLVLPRKDARRSLPWAGSTDADDTDGDGSAPQLHHLGFTVAPLLQTPMPYITPPSNPDGAHAVMANGVTLDKNAECFARQPPGLIHGRFQAPLFDGQPDPELYAAMCAAAQAPDATWADVERVIEGAVQSGRLSYFAPHCTLQWSQGDPARTGEFGRGFALEDVYTNRRRRESSITTRSMQGDWGVTLGDGGGVARRSSVARTALSTFMQARSPGSGGDDVSAAAKLPPATASIETVVKASVPAFYDPVFYGVPAGSDTVRAVRTSLLAEANLNDDESDNLPDYFPLEHTSGKCGYSCRDALLRPTFAPDEVPTEAQLQVKELDVARLAAEALSSSDRFTE
jgi:hypothetical protein